MPPGRAWSRRLATNFEHAIVQVDDPVVRDPRALIRRRPSVLVRGPSPTARRYGCAPSHLLQVLVHERDRHRALADGGGDALDGAGPHVAGGQHARVTGLQQVRITAVSASLTPNCSSNRLTSG